MARKPTDLTDANYGKMRATWNSQRQHGRYRCLARDRGYCDCEQSYIETSRVDMQVASALADLTVPDGFRERVEEAIQRRSDHADTLKKMEEIKEIVERIDFRWENGFMTPEEYIEKRSQLQREIEALRPGEYNDLIEAADLIENFQTYWDKASEHDSPDDVRQQLIAKIVDRVFIYDDSVIAIALYGDFGIALDNTTLVPNEVLQGVSEEIEKGANPSKKVCTQDGSDGRWSRAGYIIWVPQDAIYHLALRQILIAHSA